MTKRLEIYKCEICGNITMVMHSGDGTLVCCGQPMKLQKENTVDAVKEKHVPVIEKKKDGYLVKVGSIPHPMETKHYIEWIEFIADDKSYIEFLEPGKKPQAMFNVIGKKIMAREYCNLHGLWKGNSMKASTKKVVAKKASAKKTAVKKVAVKSTKKKVVAKKKGVAKKKK